MTRLVSIVIITLLLVELALQSIPVHGDQTLFYDDFTGNGQPANWKSQDFGTGTQTFQQGQGYLTLGQIGTTATITRIIANQTEPILSPATKDIQTIYMSWRLQPFNQTIQQGTRTAVEVDFGLRNCLSDTFQVCSGAKIGWKIGQQQGQLFNIGGNLINTPIIRTSQGIMFEIANLMIGPNPGDYPKYCFDSSSMITITSCGGGSFSNTNNTNTDIPYGAGQAQPLDLNQVHVFNMYAKFYPDTRKSWVAFNIDTMAWQNITQTACQCIDGLNDGGYVKLWPFVTISALESVSKPFSIATFIDSVLITDYKPTSLPTGQIIGCICPNVGPVRGGLSFDNLFQAEAYNIGGGNPAFGGIMIVLIMMTMLVLPIAIIWYRTTGHAPPGVLLTFTTMIPVFLGLSTGILPIWIGITVIILAAAVTFKVLPGHTT